jgi:lambda family phage portal protein
MKLPLINSLDLRSDDKIRSNTYAAADTTRMTGGWLPADASVNELIRASAGAVRQRIRQLVRDFPYFSRAVKVRVDYTVGSGVLLQSRVKDSNGNLSDKKNQQIEDAFRFWSDECDLAGRLHFNEMQRLANRQDSECGEFILLEHFNVKNRRNYLPYALQMIEPDWLTSDQTDRTARGTEIEQGVEYDPETGRAVAYHFTDPDGWGKTTRVPAVRVIHRFDTLRPGQMRGISAFTPGVLVAKDLNSLMDSEIDASKMASKYLAMVTTPDPLGRQSSLAITDPVSGKKIEELENAIIEYLRPGESVELATNPRPGSNFPPFIKLILCMFSISTGVPYELLSGNYEGMNYSVSKMIRTDFAHQLRPEIDRHVRHFCRRPFRSFMDSAVLTGRLVLPGYFTNPARWIKDEWQPPGMEPVDRSRESKSNIDDIDYCLRSPQEIIKSRGKDPEAVVKEIAAFKRMCDAAGLEWREVSTAMANNPAAITNQDSGRGDMQDVLDILEELQVRN